MDYYNFNSTEEEIFAEKTFSASAASFDDDDIQNNFNKNISTERMKGIVGNEMLDNTININNQVR